MTTASKGSFCIDLPSLKFGGCAPWSLHTNVASSSGVKCDANRDASSQKISIHCSILNNLLACHHAYTFQLLIPQATVDASSDDVGI